MNEHNNNSAWLDLLEGLGVILAGCLVCFLGSVMVVVIGALPALFLIWLCTLVGLDYTKSVMLVWGFSVMICGIVFYQVGLKQGKRSQNGQ